MIDLLEWNEFYNPMGFFKLMRLVVAFDYETTRVAIHTATVAKYEESNRSILN